MRCRSRPRRRPSAIACIPALSDALPAPVASRFLADRRHVPFGAFPEEVLLVNDLTTRIFDIGLTRGLPRIRQGHHREHRRRRGDVRVAAGHGWPPRPFWSRATSRAWSSSTFRARTPIAASSTPSSRKPASRGAIRSKPRRRPAYARWWRPGLGFRSSTPLRPRTMPARTSSFATSASACRTRFTFGVQETAASRSRQPVHPHPAQRYRWHPEGRHFGRLMSGPGIRRAGPDLKCNAMRPGPCGHVGRSAVSSVATVAMPGIDADPRRRRREWPKARHRRPAQRARCCPTIAPVRPAATKPRWRL